MLDALAALALTQALKVRQVRQAGRVQKTRKEEKHMKFKDMPYERVDFDQVEKEMRALMEEFDSAGSGEEQFAVHQKYYELTDRVGTQMTIAHIRYDVDTTDEFYEKEHEYYNQKRPIYHNLTLEYEKKLYASPYRAYLEEKIEIGRAHV